MRRGDTFTCVALLLGALFVAVPGTASAQFTSGSSGIHGAFPPLPEGGIPDNINAFVWNMRTGHVAYCTSYTPGTGLDVCDVNSAVKLEAQIPNIPQGGLLDGVYHFTNFEVTTVFPTTRNIFVVGTSSNVPLTILSQNEIKLQGSVNGQYTSLWVRGFDGRPPSDNAPSLSVAGGLGGPAGFAGGASGNGGTTPSNGSPGFGPAGGAGGVSSNTASELIATSAQGTALNPSLSPLTGGSGGGGGAGISTPPSGCQNLNYAGGSGGGGGGALLLAATNKVTLGSFSVIYAQGGTGGYTPNGCGYGGGGAGGNVRVVAQNIEGSGNINVSGAVRGNSTASAPGGYVRFESTTNIFNGPITGAVGGSFVSFPTAPLPANQPQLHISSIGGAAAPAAPGASLAAPDISFVAPIVAPVTLTVNASNVPIGTQVNIKVTPAIGNPTTATTAPLAGSLSASTADAQVTLPPGAGIVTATASFTAQTAILNIKFDGELARRMEVVTQPDGTSKTFVIASSGARFEIGARQ